MKKINLLFAMFGLMTISCYAQTKKDGTPDMRYRENKSQTYSEPNVVHVESYQKKDGAVIQEHNRTSPNSTDRDNWSTKPNYNPETGKQGTKEPK